MSKSSIAQQVVGLAEYYDKVLTTNQLKMFTEDLSCLSKEELAHAINEYRKNPENVFFPLPGKLISIIRPVLTEKDHAQEVSNLIIASVARYGYVNPQSARDHMGELAWEVVNKAGGWKHICEVLTQDNEGMFKAQLRGLAETVSKKAKLGELDSKPALPNPVSKMIGSAMKGIE